MVRFLESWLKLEKEFINARTPPEALVKGRYLIVGAGGVGSWMSILLTLHATPGETEIIIVDDDKLEPVNMNRLPFPVSWFLEGTPKVVALERYLPLLRPTIRVTGIAMKVDKDSLYQLVQVADIIIDTVDNVETIELISEVAKNTRKPRLSLHYDGLHGTIEWSPNGEPVGWGTGLNMQGYTAPSTAVTPVALAVLGLRILQTRPEDPIMETFEL